MILRYEARAYSYVAFLRQPYPQFEFDIANGDPGSDPRALCERTAEGFSADEAPPLKPAPTIDRMIAG